MTRAREIADIILGEWDGDRESAADFLRRRFGSEPASIGIAALNIAIGRGRALEDFSAYLDLLDIGSPAASLKDLLKYRRAQGYCAELETLATRKWQCLTCGATGTLETGGITIPVGSGSDGWPACAVCEEETMCPIESEADLSVVAGGRN